MHRQRYDTYDTSQRYQPRGNNVSRQRPPQHYQRSLSYSLDIPSDYEEQASDSEHHEIGGPGPRSLQHHEELTGYYKSTTPVQQSQESPTQYLSYEMSQMPPPQSQPQPQPQPVNSSQQVERGRAMVVDPTPVAGFEALQRAMEPSPSPPPSPIQNQAQGRSTSASDPHQTTSIGFKAISFIKGVMPLKATLHRESIPVRDSMIQRMNELGVKWSEPQGRGWMHCEHGVLGTADHVAFTIQTVVNGAPGGKPALPGGDEWFTKLYIGKDKGSGTKFREIGREVLNAAKYEVRGGARLDYSVNTWGLY